MDLHRTTGKADWEETAPGDRNVFQRTAAATHGIVSPANIITVVGLGIVIYGLVLLLQNHYWLGLILVAAGRLLDIADGVVAQATHTKSPLGEMFDATADKTGTLLTIITLILAGITYWWVVVALVLPQVIIPIVILYRRHRGIRVHPTWQGKFSMAAAWIGIVGLLVMKALDSSGLLGVGVYGLIGLSLLLGLYALGQYSTGRN